MFCDSEPLYFRYYHVEQVVRCFAPYGTLWVGNAAFGD